MHGARCDKFLRIGIVFLSLCSFGSAAESPAQINPEHLRQQAIQTLESAVRRAAEATKPNEKEITLAEKIAKQRKELIDNLAKADGPKAKDDAAKALRRALGGDPDGNTVKPQKLFDLVENLKKADTTQAKEEAAKALLTELSPSGKGEELTPQNLHEEVEKLKKSATGEEREKNAKGVLKALGPDGINLFKKDGKIDVVAMADALGLEKDKDSDARKMLADEEAKAERELAALAAIRPAPPEAGPAAGPAVGDQRIPIQPGPVQGGNPPNNGPNIDAGNIPGLGQDPFAGVNPGAQQDQVANVNQQELDRLNELNRLQRDNDQLRQQRDAAQNAGTKINAPSKTTNPPQPVQPPNISAGSPSGGGQGGGQPMPVPPPPTIPPLPGFQPPPLPPPNNDALMAELFKSIGKTGEKGGNEFMYKALADLTTMGNQNLTTLLATISTIGQTMAAGFRQPPPSLAVTRTGNVNGPMPNLYGKTAVQPRTSRTSKSGGPRTGVVVKGSGSSRITQVASTGRVSRTSQVSNSGSGEFRGPLARAARETGRAIRKSSR